MRYLLTALGTTLGLQCLRALFPLMVYVVKDRFGLGSPALGGIGLAVFAAAFLMPGMAGRLGASALPRLALALAVARAALQGWSGDPAVSLGLAAIGSIAFLGLLAGATRDLPDRPAPVGAVLLGVLIDTVFHATFGTRDLHWGGPFANPTAGVLIGLALALAWNARGPALEIPRRALARPSALGLLAVGPFLYLALEVLANVARFSARTGLETAVSGTIVAAGLALAWIAARLVPRTGFWGGPATVLLAGAGLARALLWSDAPGPMATPVLLLAQVSAAVLLARAPSGRASFIAATSALLLALVPLSRPLLFAPAAPPDPGHPVLTRIVSLNLHAAFDELGAWSFDRQMEHLRDVRPDVVALQEVSRGWVINGSADLFELARESLGMPGEPGPSVRHDWGNAVFARHRPLSFENVPLPPDSLPITRAVSVADVRVPGTAPLRVMATHLHHPQADTSVRDRQAEFIAAQEIPASVRGGVLLGDFNALPDSRCFGILNDAGWTDIYQESLLRETGEGRTYPSAAPERRIDTILYRGPWRVAASGVAPPWGSDHRAVWADLEPVRP